MYSLTAIFTKQPVAIAGAVRSVLMVLILVGLVSVGEEALAGIALALEVVLTLFVVSTSTPTNNATLKEGTSVKVEGTDDTVQIAAPPKQSIGIEGGADHRDEEIGEFPPLAPRE
jgi:hypothetical protein